MIYEGSLIYCIDYKINFKVSGKWEEYKIGDYKVSDFLNSDGFYVFDINDDRFRKIKENFNEYISLELINDNDKGLFYALSNFCETQGYNMYNLRLSEDVLNKIENILPIKYFDRSSVICSSLSRICWYKIL